MSIYIPFTYLIGWSSQNTFYYGRKTQKGCNPSDLWTKYFTSSREVKEFRKEYGEPDIIQIRKTFPNNPDGCKLWECKVLRKLDAQNDPRFLNKRNGDHKWDTTGMVSVRDSNNNTFLISKDDPRYLSGELVSVTKGKVMVRDKEGNCFPISIDDPRYISGELSHVAKGTKQSKETIEKRVKHVRGVPKTPEHNRKNSEANKGMCCGIILATGKVIKVSKLDPRWESGEIVGVNKNRANGRVLLTGEIVYISVDDPRWKTGEIVGILKKNTHAIVKETGEIIKTSIHDPRWLTGELSGVGRGNCPKKFKCIHCGKEVDPGNYKQYHGENCKQNPEYTPNSKKEIETFVCNVCGKLIKGKGCLVQHQNGKKCKTSPNVF